MYVCMFLKKSQFPKTVAQRQKKTKVVFLQKKDERKKVDVNWKASHSDADGKQENMAGYFNGALPIPLSLTESHTRREQNNKYSSRSAQQLLVALNNQ